MSLLGVASMGLAVAGVTADPASATDSHHEDKTTTVTETVPKTETVTTTVTTGHTTTVPQTTTVTVTQVAPPVTTTVTVPTTVTVTETVPTTVTTTTSTEAVVTETAPGTTVTNTVTSGVAGGGGVAAVGSQPSGNLPFTGLPAWMFLVGGALLAGMGLLIWVVSGRRYKPQH
jgi:hypothetical protein